MSKFFTLFCLIFSYISFTSTTIYAETIKIATWNIAWLGSHKNNQRKSDDYTKLRHYAKKLKADVIALQEVESARWAKKVLGNDYYYFFTRKDWHLRVGFAVKKSRQFTVDVKEYSPLDEGSLRRGLDVTLSKNGKTLRLLAVHLKSGCFEHLLDKASLKRLSKKRKHLKTACKALAKQARPLETWIDTRAQEDHPFIILGDFNRRFTQDIANAHSEQQGLWQAIDDIGKEALSAPSIGHHSKCWGGYYPYHIDHIILDERAKKYYLQNSFGELVFDEKNTAKNRKNLSDHCPIFIELSF